MIKIIGVAMYGLPPQKRLIASAKNPESNDPRVKYEEITLPGMNRNHELAARVLMDFSRLRGYIVEKKQSLSAHADLSKMGKAELTTTLSAMLDQLAPGERQRILDIAAGAVDEETLTP